MSDTIIINSNNAPADTIIINAAQAPSDYINLNENTGVISVNGKFGVVILNASDIGLDQVDNTSDLNKPISNATLSAILLKADLSAFNILNNFILSKYGSWDSVYATVNTLSGNWNSVYSNVNYLSSSWNDAYSYVISNSGIEENQQEVASFVNSNSANILNVYSSVNITSANWNDSYTNLTLNSAAYLSAVDLSFLSVSGNWNDAYAYVNSTSATNNPDYNVSTFAKLSAQVYQAGTGSNSIQPINGNNTASEYYSNVAGGTGNNASGYSSNVAGGTGNNASEYYSNVAGGTGNNASGIYSNIAGGAVNNASGYSSNVAGGCCNNACGDHSNVAGGYNNNACGWYSNVAGGIVNNACGWYSNVAGGGGNNASGPFSNVAGGFCNTASGDYSGILGGNNNNTNNQACSFIIGQGITADQPNFTYVNNLSSLGTVAASTINDSVGTSDQWNTAYSSTTSLNLSVGYWNDTFKNQANYLPLSGGVISGKLGIGTSEPITKLDIEGNFSSEPALKIGSLEFQPYSINNAWFGENIYFNGGSFLLRNNGSSGAFYFQGVGGSGHEGQFRFTSNGSAGDTVNPNVQLKTSYTGEFGVGSSISYQTGNFQGSNFYVSGNGNVGIGTISPTEKLQVAGNIQINTASGNGYIRFNTLPDAYSSQFYFANNGSDVWHFGPYWPNNNNFDFWSTITQSVAFTIDAEHGVANSPNGFVVGSQIGGYVYSGGHKMQIIASGSQTPLMIEGGSGAIEIWADEYATNAVSFGTAVPGNTKTSDFIFAKYAPCWSETMRIKTDTGNVGIGTSSPSTKLEVNGTITSTNGNSDQWNSSFTNLNNLSSTYAAVTAVNGTIYQINAVNTNGVVDLSIPNSFRTPGDLNVGGNLYVSGSAINLSTATLSVSSPIIYINNSLSGAGNVFDIGLVGHFKTNIYQHTGLVRSAQNNYWSLFSGLTSEPLDSPTLNYNDPTFTIDTLRANILGSLSGNVTGNADTVTNGVYTNISYSDPSWITSIADTKVTGSKFATNTLLQSTSALLTPLTNFGSYQTSVATTTGTLLPISTYQSTSGSFATNTLLQSTSALLTPLTTTSTLTSQLVTNTDFKKYQTSVAASTATLLSTSVYQNASGNWQTTYNTVSSLSANWNSAYNISSAYQNASGSYISKTMALAYSIAL